jgi:hypothetical protein
MHPPILLVALTTLAAALPAQLFTGVDVALPMRSSTLGGFPNVTYSAHASFQVNGMAAHDDGNTLILATGAFSTNLYRSLRGAAPTLLVPASIDLHGLACGRGQLYGFSNYTSPRGIYAIDTGSGASALVADIAASGYRFFGLGYNATDDSLYGYTEYGSPTGLYRIDIDTGTCTFVAPSIPASNTQGRGLACANHTVYVTATRGLDGVPYYAYDLRQGSGGTWLPFTNPFTTTNATGGSAVLEVRQPWLGYRGQGHVTLSCTGAALRSGSTATLRIHSDLPNAIGFLMMSLSSSPTYLPLLQCTVLQWPPSILAQLDLGPTGMFAAPLRGGGGPASFYLQYVMSDPRTPSGWAVSNGLRLDFLP